MDHVENYNPSELDYYIEFIDKLAEAKVQVVVLSRPLINEISWKNGLAFSSEEGRHVYLLPTEPSKSS